MWLLTGWTSDVPLRVARATAACVVISALAAGCGSRDNVTTAPTPQSQSPATAVTAAPAPPSVTAAAPATTSSAPRIAQAGGLLTTEELTQQFGGITFTADPAGASPGTLKLISTADGPVTVQESTQVFPPVCAGVVFTGDATVYGNTQVEQMTTEMFQRVQDGSGSALPVGPVVVAQTVAMFPTAADAQNLFDTQKRQWQSCKDKTGVATQYDKTVNVRVMGSPSVWSAVEEFVLGTISEKTTLGSASMAISMASNDGINPADACQQAMGIHGNTIVEARTCNWPKLPDPGPAPGDSQFPPRQEPNPAWATPDAQRLVEAMLDKIR